MPRLKQPLPGRHILFHHFAIQWYCCSCYSKIYTRCSTSFLYRKAHSRHPTNRLDWRKVHTCIIYRKEATMAILVHIHIQHSHPTLTSNIHSPLFTVHYAQPSRSPACCQISFSAAKDAKRVIPPRKYRTNAKFGGGC